MVSKKEAGDSAEQGGLEKRGEEESESECFAIEGKTNDRKLKLKRRNHMLPTVNNLENGEVPESHTTERRNRLSYSEHKNDVLLFLDRLIKSVEW